MAGATYGIAKELGLGYEEAVALTREVLKEHGFGVITEIDVQKTMKEKLDVDFKPYVILGACNPKLALEALSVELDIGLMMPCNVVVYEQGPGSAVVEAVSPLASMKSVENAEVLTIMERVEGNLRTAMAALEARATA